LKKLRRRAPRQAELLGSRFEIKRSDPGRRNYCARSLSINQTLRAVEKRGFIRLHEEAVARDPHADEQFPRFRPTLTLNSETGPRP